MGSTESVSWEYYSSTIQAVKNLLVKVNQFGQLNKLKCNTTTEFQTNSKKSYCFVLGNEVKGVDQQVVDYCNKAIEIPQFGTKHSLNISVAAGIIWDFFIKMRPKIALKNFSNSNSFLLKSILSNEYSKIGNSKLFIIKLISFSNFLR